MWSLRRLGLFSQRAKKDFPQVTSWFRSVSFPLFFICLLSETSAASTVSKAGSQGHIDGLDRGSTMRHNDGAGPDVHCGPLLCLGVCVCGLEIRYLLSG